MTTTRKKLLLVAWPLSLFVFVLVACRQDKTPEKPDSELTPAEFHGKKVFVARCTACHEAHSTKAFHGPGLGGIMQRKYLPSGAPANDERVRAVIEHGRNNMPALGNVMDDKQIEDVIAYLHTL